MVGLAARILVDPRRLGGMPRTRGNGERAAGPDRGRSEVVNTVSKCRTTTPQVSTQRAKRCRPRPTHGCFGHAFGAKRDVDPVRHLVATAVGWGGLPGPGSALDRRRTRCPRRGVQTHRARRTGRRLLVDLGQHPEGFFQANDCNAYSVTNIAAASNDDGSVTVTSAAAAIGAAQAVRVTKESCGPVANSSPLEDLNDPVDWLGGLAEFEGPERLGRRRVAQPILTGRWGARLAVSGDRSVVACQPAWSLVVGHRVAVSDRDLLTDSMVSIDPQQAGAHTPADLAARMGATATC